MWVTNSIKASSKLRKHFKLHDIDIFIKDRLPKEIDPEFVFLYIAKRIPAHLLLNIDIMYVGKFKNLEDKGANALYEDGAIYITNQQSDDMDMIDDIVHEIAHSNEEKYQDLIYSDGTLEKEFMSKRKILYNILKNNLKLNPPPSLLHDPNQRDEVEGYLYDTIGYAILNQIIVGIFNSTYATVSVREYFSRGFEEYILGEPSDLKKESPVLYSKITELIALGEN